MRLLLDTCTVVWAVQESRRLSSSARVLLETRANPRYVSAVSLWEIGSKQKSGRLELAVPLAALADLLVENLAVEFLPMMPSHSLRVTQLPDVHKDPFDRMLVCQAIGEDLVLLTPDPLVAQYPVRTHW